MTIFETVINETWDSLQDELIGYWHLAEALGVPYSHVRPIAWIMENQKMILQLNYNPKHAA